eukprot:scaffold3970_cov417-Prasinococcus_capsulatus_cf.AAC.7
MAAAAAPREAVPRLPVHSAGRCMVGLRVSLRKGIKHQHTGPDCIHLAGGPNMVTCEEVRACSFPAWYERFKDDTFPSEV